METLLDFWILNIYSAWETSQFALTPKDAMMLSVLALCGNEKETVPKLLSVFFLCYTLTVP